MWGISIWAHFPCLLMLFRWKQMLLYSKVYSLHLTSLQDLVSAAIGRLKKESVPWEQARIVVGLCKSWLLLVLRCYFDRLGRVWVHGNRRGLGESQQRRTNGLRELKGSGAKTTTTWQSFQWEENVEILFSQRSVLQVEANESFPCAGTQWVLCWEIICWSCTSGTEGWNAHWYSLRWWSLQALPSSGSWRANQN